VTPGGIRHVEYLDQIVDGNWSQGAAVMMLRNEVCSMTKRKRRNGAPFTIPANNSEGAASRREAASGCDRLTAGRIKNVPSYRCNTKGKRLDAAIAGGVAPPTAQSGVGLMTERD